MSSDSSKPRQCISELVDLRCERDYHEKGNHYAYENGKLIQWIQYPPRARATEGTPKLEEIAAKLLTENPVTGQWIRASSKEYLVQSLRPFITQEIRVNRPHDFSQGRKCLRCSMDSQGSEGSFCSVQASTGEKTTSNSAMAILMLAQFAPNNGLHMTPQQIALSIIDKIKAIPKKSNLCEKCGKPKERSRPNSKLCRSCDSKK